MVKCAIACISIKMLIWYAMTAQTATAVTHSEQAPIIVTAILVKYFNVSGHAI